MVIGFQDRLTSMAVKLLICLGISLPVKSQTLFNLGGTEIFISQGETISIVGNVENSGNIINAGTILMAGNWSNTGTYNSIQGSFTLNGADEQQVNHNGQNFFDLTINGTGEKILDSDVLIGNQITFESGLVTPANNSVLLVGNGAQILGGSGASYVNGMLAIEGTGDKFFPIGKNGKFKPINLYNIQGTTPTIGFEVFEPNNDPQAPKELQAISTTRYWQKTQIAGSTSNGRIALTIGEDDGINDLFLAVVTEADQPGEIFQNLGRSETTGDLAEGSVTSDMPITDGNKIYALGQEVDLTGIDCVPGALATLSSNLEERAIKVYCSNISEENFSFKIYNKWGLVVYETTSLQDATEAGWDGINTNTGNPEKNDVYRYVLSGKFLNGNELSRVGTITKIN